MQLISVVLPCYNASKTLAQTLQSINSQTLDKFECVIINDGSTDNTLSIIESFEFRKGITKSIISRSNKGFLFSLEEGIKNSTGNLIARIDSDDLWEPEHLLILSHVLEEEDLVFIGANAKIINDKGSVIGETKMPCTYETLIKSLLKDNAVIHSSVIFRKEAYFKTSGYLCGEGDFFKHIADYNLWVELSFMGRCRNVNECTVSYRYLDNSMSRTIEKVTNYRARRYVMKKMHSHYKKYSLYYYIWLMKVNLRIVQYSLLKLFQHENN